MNLPRSFLWHDYETFGTNPALDRPAQFAAIRTDADLNVIGEPMEWFCAPADDMLPHPAACLVTGITPQQARREGVCEARFAQLILDEMMEPGTCVAGYNSIRFDDEFSRNIFYRNFHDPYAREWQNGNSRWDLIDLGRMCYALRPEGIEWPEREPGVPSFKLEDLTAANGIGHEGAHDALVDVRATIDFARLIREQQPRLFQWALEMRDKKTVAKLLDPANPVPVLHTTMRIPASRGCTSMVLPICAHPEYQNSIIVFDLMTDPGPLLTESAEQIQDLVFTPAADLPEGVERLPLKAIKTNAVPMVAPVEVLRDVDVARIGLDPERCKANASKLLEHIDNVRYKVMDVFVRPADSGPSNPDLMIYSGGFFSGADKRLMGTIPRSAPELLGQSDWAFKDPRLPEMLFRYRARNYPETLSSEELDRWNTFRLQQLRAPDDSRQLSYSQFIAALNEARAAHVGNGPAQGILDQLEAWSIELGLTQE